MKKTVIFLLSVIQLCLCCMLPAFAKEESYHWYCVHAKDHVQPGIGGDIAFVEELDGYYIDRSHTDPTAEEKVIYLTFDAGYENGNVAKILDTLKAESVPAAFFVLEHLVTKNTDLIKRMTSEGHTVCNHTARHKDMSKCDSRAFLEELHAMEEIYESAVGEKLSSYYRPPEGKFSRENLVTAKENGYKTIFWSFAYPDWDNNKQMSPEKAKSIILDNAHNGEVMLLHPTSKTNALILGDVIKELKSQGYRFGTLDELTKRE